MTIAMATTPSGKVHAVEVQPKNTGWYIMLCGQKIITSPIHLDKAKLTCKTCIRRIT